MKWDKPPKTDPLHDRYITSGAWVICKAFVFGKPIYTLSHRGRLVWTGTLDECKGRANDHAHD